jgi:hypothetical protein
VAAAPKSTIIGSLLIVAVANNTTDSLSMHIPVGLQSL